MGCIACCLVGLFLAAMPFAASAASPAQETRDEAGPEVAVLISQLGDPSFERRQWATQRLIQIGPPAKDKLIEGLRSVDAEIRSRCRRISALVLDLDHEPRVDAFASDALGRSAHGLPGWQRYAQLVGDSAAARELFVAMQREEPYLLEAAQMNPLLVADTFTTRCEQLQQQVFATDLSQRRSVSLATVAALFFVASNPQVNVSDEMISYLHSLSYQPAFQQALQIRGDRMEHPLRKLLGAWVARSTTSLSNYQNFVLALRYDLPEALRPACDALRTEQGKPHVLHYALLIVGRFGETDQLPAIEALMNDTSACGTFRVDDMELATEVRDLALAVALHLTARDHEEYGYAALRKNAQLLFAPNTVGFRNETERAAAFTKWKVWRTTKISQSN